MLFMALVFVLCMAMPNISYAAIADGTYSVDYQVNKPNDSSASIANDYFAKPATLTVKDGQMTMQLTIKSSTWVTEFNPPGGARVVSEDAQANERVVQFPVDRADVVTIPMTIDIDDINYHHSYSVDFVFDSANLPQATAPQKEEQKPSAPVTEEQPQASQQQQQPQQPVAQTPAVDEQQSAQPNTTTSSSSQTTTSTEQATPKTEAAQTATTTTQNDRTTTAQEPNPETSDPVPFMYGVLFIVAAFIFMRTTKRKAI